MAIMGPSGFGKSTILDSLAGRLAGNVIMTGNILLNGKKRRLDYGVVAYVTQENVLLGTLTVRKTVTYSAQLRLPTSMRKHQIREAVESTLVEMGLQDCADRTYRELASKRLHCGDRELDDDRSVTCAQLLDGHYNRSWNYGDYHDDLWILLAAA
ncbi:hypothetical protein AAC387_Pa10g1292 [Persea americana]